MSTKKKAKTMPAEPEALTPEHGKVIALATQKGADIAIKAFGSDVLTRDLSTTIQKVVSEHMSVTPMGLVVTQGYLPSEAEVTEVLAGLSGINEETAKFRNVLTWIIGDAAILASELDGASDRVIAQAIKERGVSKHTAMCAYAVCRGFPMEERMPGVSFTHHQEIHNARKKIKNQSGLESLLAELRKQGESGEVMSCKELRERLAILCGKVEEEDEEKPDKEPEVKKTGKFYYVAEDGSVKMSIGLNREVCLADQYLVINVDEDCVVDKAGKPYFNISQLDEDNGIPA